MSHFSSRYVLVTSLFVAAPLRILCGPAEQHFENPRHAAAPLVQGSLGTTLLFHMISRHQASDPSWSNPPTSRILPIPYFPTEPARKDTVPSSQSEKRSVECAHQQHISSLLNRGRRPTRRIRGAGVHVLWCVLLYPKERNKARRSRDRSACRR